MLDEELNLSKLNLWDDYSLNHQFNLLEKLQESMNNIELRNYDKIVRFLEFNSKSQRLFVSFANS